MAANESAAIAALKTFTEAQTAFHKSSSGYWGYAGSLAQLQDAGFVDASFASAEGLPQVAQAKSGYVFKVLTAQGPNARGGALSYLVDGKLTHGYALLAIPSNYDKTGRNCFMVNQEGQVFQKDCGSSETEALLREDTYNPDATWTVAE